MLPRQSHRGVYQHRDLSDAPGLRLRKSIGIQGNRRKSGTDRVAFPLSRPSLLSQVTWDFGPYLRQVWRRAELAALRLCAIGTRAGPQEWITGPVSRPGQMLLTYMTFESLGVAAPVLVE